VAELGNINWRGWTCWLAVGLPADLGLVYLLSIGHYKSYTGKIHRVVCLSTKDISGEIFEKLQRKVSHYLNGL